MMNITDFRKLCSKIFNGSSLITNKLQKVLQDTIIQIESDKKKDFATQDFTLKIPMADSSKLELYKKLENIYKNCPFFDLLIVGSYADLTFTHESDVDSIVIIKREAFNNKETLNLTKKILSRLNNLFQRTDPTQHHGHWIFTEYDFINYDESTMPVSVLEEAVSIGRTLEISMHIDSNQSKTGFSKILQANLESVHKKSEDLLSGQCNLYNLKILISSISLLPALMFQNSGHKITKKEAIQQIKNILEPIPLTVINWSTSIRENWHNVPTYRMYKTLSYLSYIIQSRQTLERISKLMPAISIKQVKKLITPSRADFELFLNAIETYVKNH